MINAAVLTISDSASAGTRPDRSGPAVRDRLEQLGWSVSVIEMIPDEAAEISARLATLADGGQVSAIFTTGGTGVAPPRRDAGSHARRDRPRNPRLWRIDARCKGREATPLGRRFRDRWPERAAEC